MVVTYVDAIRAGIIPCVESAIIAVSERENKRAMQGGVDVYNAMMLELLLPTMNDLDLIDQHIKSQQKAVKHFLDRAILDEEHKYQRCLNVRSIA